MPLLPEVNAKNKVENSAKPIKMISKFQKVQLILEF